ncbi:MAG: lipid-A-disaccharide synthase [Myxococcota bacterium]|nr:lipid-A-disaccharide synthase [Myxococcota bacterium]
MRKKKILISAAEPSGDALGALLIQALSAQHSIEAVGLTGPKLRDAGVQSLFRMEEMCAMGLVEVLKKRKPILEAKRRLHDALDDSIDVCIAIDAPDLHLPLLRAAKERSIFSVGYVSPQIWAWRKGRSKTVARSMDRLLCLFDFEPALYPTDFDAQWVGHPIADRLPQKRTVQPRHFALFPGSRQHEIDRHLPIYLQTAALIEDARFTLSIPKHLQTPTLPDNVERTEEGAAAALTAQAALCKSGTISLELAHLNIPTVVAHRVHPLTYAMARLFVRHLPYFAMPNILSQEEVMPEYIQHLRPSTLAQALQTVKAPEADLRSIGEPGAVQRAANLIWREA